MACAGSLELPAKVSSDTEIAPWGNPRGDCGNWAFADGKSGAPVEMWRAKLKVPILATPVAGDGAIFVGTPIKRVFAFDAISGKKLGKMWVDIPIEDGLSYSSGLLVMAGRSIYNRLRAYDLNSGNYRWEKKSDRAAASPIICGNRIFYSTAKGAFFAIDLETGEKIWRRGFEEAVIEHEPAFRDSLVFLADLNGRLFCLSADSGNIRWEITLPGAPVGPPVVIPDHVIIPTSTGRIPVITLDGAIRVEIEAPGEIFTPIACTGPTVYGVTRHGIAFAGDLGEGGILWQVSLGEPVIVPPVVWGRDLAVITASGKLKLFHFGDGSNRGELDLKSHVSAAPIIYNSILYIATEEGELIAVGRSESALEREK